MNTQSEQSRIAVSSVWNDRFFILFMGLRFPNEISKDYITEWKNRLQTGNPFGYMDEETLNAYKKAVDVFTEVK